jgi:hypothetical protein
MLKTAPSILSRIRKSGPARIGSKPTKELRLATGIQRSATSEDRLTEDLLAFLQIDNQEITPNEIAGDFNGDGIQMLPCLYDPTKMILGGLQSLCRFGLENRFGQEWIQNMVLTTSSTSRILLVTQTLLPRGFYLLSTESAVWLIQTQLIVFC